MRLITCAVCGIPLSPQNAKKCAECGRYVCREHAVYYPPTGKWICVNCLEKKAKKREERAVREVVLAISSIEW